MNKLLIIYPKQDVKALVLAKKIAFDAKQKNVESQLLDDSQLATLDNAFATTTERVAVVGDVNVQSLSTFADKTTLVNADNVHQGNAYEAVLNQGISPIATHVTSNNQKPLSFVGITACPTGVAHTFMSAEALENIGKELGYQVKIETQGSVGAKNILTDDEIANADFVILATDIEVNADRFVGKKLYRTSTAQALKQTKQTFENAIAQAAVHGGAGTTTAKASTNKTEKTGFYKHLMTGVSHMLPLVVAGGLLIAISFMFGIEAFKDETIFHGIPKALMDIGGGAAFHLMIAVFAGYVAFSIADRPGLAVGLIGGMLATMAGAGILGGIIAGFLAGYVVKGLNATIKLPATFNFLKNRILILPLFGTLIVGPTP